MKQTEIGYDKQNREISYSHKKFILLHIFFYWYFFTDLLNVDSQITNKCFMASVSSMQW